MQRPGLWGFVARWELDAAPARVESAVQPERPAAVTVVRMLSMG